MSYSLPPDNQPDQSFTGVEITTRGKVQMVGDRRRWKVVIGERLEVASRLPLDAAMQRAIAVTQRGRYDAEVSIQPAIDIPRDYLYHGMTTEYEACKKRHQQRQREARKARRSEGKR